MNIEQQIEQYMDQSMELADEGPFLLELVADPQGVNAMQSVLADRGIIQPDELQSIFERVEAKLFGDTGLKKLVRVWHNLEQRLVDFLNPSDIQVMQHVPSPSYLAGEAATVGELRIDVQLGPSSYRTLHILQRTQTRRDTLSVSSGDILRLQWWPFSIGYGVVFAGGEQEIKRLVYPQERQQATLVTPEHPLEMFWQVDPEPKQLHLLFFLAALEREQRVGDVFSNLRPEPNGLWSAESEVALLEDIFSSANTSKEGVKVTLTVRS